MRRAARPLLTHRCAGGALCVHACGRLYTFFETAAAAAAAHAQARLQRLVLRTLRCTLRRSPAPVAAHLTERLQHASVFAMLQATSSPSSGQLFHIAASALRAGPGAAVCLGGKKC